MDDTAYDDLVFDEEGGPEDSESEAQGAEIVQFEIDDESDTEEKPRQVATNTTTNEPVNTTPAAGSGDKKKDDAATRNEEPLHTRMEQAVQLLKSRATELNMPAAKQIPKEFDKEFSVIAGLRQELYARGVPANLLKALKQISTFAQISDATFKSHLKKLLQTTDVNAVKRDIDTLKQKVKDSVRADMQKAVDKRGSEKAKDTKAAPTTPATTDAAAKEKKLEDKERQNLEKKGLEKEYIDLIAQFKSSGCKYIWSTPTKTAFVELIDKVIENAARQNLIRESKESSDKEVKDICNDIKIFWPSTQQLQQKYKSFKEGKKPSEKKDDKGVDTKKEEGANMAPPSDASTTPSEPKKKKKNKKQADASATITTNTPGSSTPTSAKKPEKKRKRTSITKESNSSSSAPATPVSTPIAAIAPTPTPVPPQQLQQQLQQQHISVPSPSIMSSLQLSMMQHGIPGMNSPMQMRQYPAITMFSSPTRVPHQLLTNADQSPTRNMYMQQNVMRSPQPANILLQKQPQHPPPPAGNKP